MRLFVAVWPPPEVRAVLESLDRPDHPSVKWVNPEQWHVTLRFLGEVDGADVERLADALGAVGQVPALAATLGPRTCRQGRGTLVVPVAGIERLHESVAAAVDGFGTPEPDRPFIGHLTLARSRRGKPMPHHLEGQSIDAAWTVREVALVRSHLEENGPRYETLVSIPLATAPG